MNSKLHDTGLLQLDNATGDMATVSLYGAQVLSWCTAACGEQLYCSTQTAVDKGQAVRGGVPICFPQFASRGPLVKHGFARTSLWRLVGEPVAGPDVDVASAQFVLQDSVLTRAIWPCSFALRLYVTLGSGWMELLLEVENKGDFAFDFTAALHTYLATSDVRQATVYRLAGTQFLDALNSNARSTQTELDLHVTSEVDRVYLGAPRVLELQQNGQPYLRMEQQGFADTVVWNPGPLKAVVLGDMPPTDWTRMLCIEAAQIEHPVLLEPNGTWQGQQRLMQSTQQRSARNGGR